MKVVLVFSPFVVPSYIPLGVAQLKSYVERELPSVRVCNLDLNNYFFNNLTKEEFLIRCKNLCYICSKKDEHQKHRMDIFNYRKLYTVALHCLKDKKSKEFYDFTKYNKLIYKIVAFFFQWENCIFSLSKNIIENENKIPRILKELFRDDINRILNEKPGIIGFSIFSDTQLAYSLMLAKILKEKANLPIVFGGALISHIDTSEFLKLFNFIDFIINPEGETGLVEFIKHLKGKDFKNVSNLSYRKKGKVIQNKKRFVENLDNLPFPNFGDFNLSQYLFPTPVLPIIFSRGCFWKRCTFCTYFKNYPAPYKTKSIKKFVEEIRHYNAQGIKYFFFDDDVISADDLNLVSIALHKKNIKIFFGAMVKPAKDFTFEVLRNIYTAGGRVLFWGVESSCQRMLNLMNKGTKIKYIKSILKNSFELSFHNHLFMILGFPSQTEKEIIKDMEFLRKNRNYINSFYIHDFSLQRDSYIFNNFEKFKIKDLRKIPIYVTEKGSFYSDQISFKCNAKLNWAKIHRMKNAMFLSMKKLFPNEFDSYEYSHMLIHASLTNKMGITGE